jgi:uncharacterized protein YjiS (DUF1127 family)
MHFMHDCSATWHLLRRTMEPYLLGNSTVRFSGRINQGEPSMLVAILNFLQSWRRYNASLNELSQLGDRELADIGITRSDIPRVAWETANR